MRAARPTEAGWLLLRGLAGGAGLLAPFTGMLQPAGGPGARLELVGAAAAWLALGTRLARPAGRRGADMLVGLVLAVGLTLALWARFRAPTLALPVLLLVAPASAWVALSARSAAGAPGRLSRPVLLTRALLLGALPYALDAAPARNLAGVAVLALLALTWRPGAGRAGVLLACAGLGLLVPSPGLGGLCLGLAAAALTPAPADPAGPPAPGSTPGRPPS